MQPVFFHNGNFYVADTQGKLIPIRFSGFGGGVIKKIIQSGGGSVNSVSASAPLISSGGINPNISLTGVIPIGNGGTGQNNANAALNALLPNQVGNNLKFLQTDGANATWQFVVIPVPNLAQVLNQGSDSNAAGVINDDNSIPSIEINGRRLNSTDLDNYINWDNGDIFTGPGATEIRANLYSSILYDGTQASLDWLQRELVNSGAVTTLNWETLELSGAWTLNSFPVLKGLSASAILDFPDTPSQQSADLTIGVPGAALNDVVQVGIPSAAAISRTCFTGFVSAVNVVTIRFNNYSVLDIDPPSGTFNVIVFK